MLTMRGDILLPTLMVILLSVPPLRAGPGELSEALFRRTGFARSNKTQLTADEITLQAAGAFGHLTLHSCWAIDGVIGRKYHGQYTSANNHYIKNMLAMYEETGDAGWKRRAEDGISNIMFLQAKSGGFYHGAAEHEPAYEEGKTCAMHQNMIIPGLLEYAGKPYADTELERRFAE